MAEWQEAFNGERFTYLYKQEIGKHNAKYPWVIHQNKNGSTVKMDDSQMLKLVKAVLKEWGYETDFLPQ